MIIEAFQLFTENEMLEINVWMLNIKYFYSLCLLLLLFKLLASAGILVLFVIQDWLSHLLLFSLEF